MSEIKEYEDGDIYIGKFNMFVLLEIEYDFILESTENNLVYECFFFFVYINYYFFFLD